MKEKILTPEINKEELLRVVNNLKFEDRETFSFNGSRYLLFLCTQEDVDSDEFNEKVFFAASTEDRGGWDIYILKTLSVEEKRRMMFHEILECNLIDQGSEGSSPHSLAKNIEEEVFGPR